jgi:dienelactone hydrolase
LPAVIVLHGTGQSKERMHGWLEKLARRGLVGVAIDARPHGDRAGGAEGAARYEEAIVRAWRAGPDARREYPLYFDTCWDLWRTVDYLGTRGDVDGRRLGMIGFSMGGIQTWLAAGVDERIRVAVPALAVQSFRWGLENEQWHGRAGTVPAAHQAAARDLGEAGVTAAVCRALWGKVLPGILDRFDGPSMLRLFAGRPLLILKRRAGFELSPGGYPPRRRRGRGGVPGGGGGRPAPVPGGRGQRPRPHAPAEAGGARLAGAVADRAGGPGRPARPALRRAVAAGRLKCSARR